MARITINGRTIEAMGPITMRGGKFYDGLGQEIDINNLDSVKEAKTINITIEGDINKLDIDSCNTVTVNGNVGKVDTGSGNISCQIIQGDADTGSGNIQCDTIMGDADTGSGNIYVNHLGGKASTGSGRVYEDGHEQSKASSRGYGFTMHTNNGPIFGGTSVFSHSGDVISGGVVTTQIINGQKVTSYSRDCVVNGRRIGDMSKTELQEFIARMAKKGKIVTII